MSERRPFDLSPAIPDLVADPEPVGAYEAKTHLARLLDRVEAGERFVITRHGRPIAVLAPATAHTDTGQVIEAIRALASTLPEGTLDVRAARAEGRE